MSVSLHVAKKYEVSYSSSSRFNYQQWEVYALLTHMGMNVMGEEFDDEFDVDRQEYEDCLGNILDPEFEDRELVDDDIRRLFEYEKDAGIESLRQMAYDDLKVFLDESDAKSGDIHFSWF